MIDHLRLKLFMKIPYSKFSGKGTVNLQIALLTVYHVKSLDVAIAMQSSESSLSLKLIVVAT